MMNTLFTPLFVLRFGVSMPMIVFGIDQFVRPSKWFPYLPEFLIDVLHLERSIPMRLHASGNIILGILLLLGLFQPWITWISLVWWLSILPFAYRHNWRIGVRDTGIFLSLLALWWLR